MSSSSTRQQPASLYNACLGQGILTQVGVDDVQILRAPSPGTQRAIGTAGLNGCSCLIVSGAAVILGHVSPIPGSTEDWQGTTRAQQDTASLEHHRRFLRRITQLYYQHQNEFPISTTAWGVFSRGELPVMEHVASLFRAHLRDLGHEMQDSYYKDVEVRPGQPGPPPPHGELVVIRGGGRDGIWLDRQNLEGSAQPRRSGAQSSARTAPMPFTAAVASSSRTERPQASTQGSGDLAQTTQRQPTMADYVGMAQRRLEQIMNQGGTLQYAIDVIKPTLMQMTGLNSAQADHILRGNRS